MRKLLVVGALVLGQAQAAGWEYGFLNAGAVVGWRTAAGQIDAPSGYLRDLIPKLKCKGGDYLSFFNCVGRQGWEFVGREPFGSADDVTYIFRRSVK